MTPYRIEHYLTADAQDDLYLRWLSRLRDRQAKIAVIRRVNRIEQGNFGDIDRAVNYWQDWQQRNDHEKQRT